MRNKLLMSLLLISTLLIGYALGQSNLTIKWDSPNGAAYIEMTSYGKTEVNGFPKETAAPVIERIQMGLRSDGVVVWRDVGKK